MLPTLRRYWPEGARRYIEPFCGSACLFFDLEPTAAVLGDLNPELIATYRALRNDASLVCESLRRLPKGRAAYYALRATPTVTLCEVEIAARFIYLNRYCFNGIYRTNKDGKFNVPYGKPKGSGQFDFDRIVTSAKLLKNAILVDGDFERTLSHVERGDFVYLDPPYAIAKRRVFSQYHQQSFAIEDLDRLGNALSSIDRKGAWFAISYGDSREARKLLAHWNPQRVRTRRHIAGFADCRRNSFELIATNFSRD